MNAWIYLAVAIIANITCNVTLKKLMTGLDAQTPLALAIQALKSGWFWIAGVAGFTLLLSYLLALRTIDLSASYAAVTSVALVGITIASVIFLGEQVSVLKITGVALVVVGIFLISQTQSV